MKMRNDRVAVIGSGLGGIAVACRLAATGRSVTVFERNGTPGGKIQEIRKQGFRFDTGPSLLTMDFVLDELFQFCGENRNDYLTLTEPAPLCRYFYPDGVRFDNFRQSIRSVREIERFAPEDRDAYLRFLEYSRDLYTRTADAFLFNPLFQFSDLRSVKLSDILKTDPFRTVASRVGHTFQSTYLRQFFNRFPTYNGSSPYQAPATLNVIPHVEINQGGYYVSGGFYRIPEALVRLAQKLGVTFRYHTAVQKIETAGGRVCGLLLDDGSKFETTLVISNSDATETLTSLLGRPVIPARKIERLKRAEPSCSGFVLLLGTDRQWSQLRHHNIFFSHDYKREFKEIFKQGVMPDDPTIYLANTSFTDPVDAPEGGSNLFILVNAPWIREGQNWDQIRSGYPDTLLNLLEKRGLDGIRESVRYRETITPADFKSRYHSFRGSIYGTSSNSRLAAFLRPKNKVREVDGLYLAGGSSHPGGGIPLVLLSARHAADLVKRFEA